MCRTVKYECALLCSSPSSPFEDVTRIRLFKGWWLKGRNPLLQRGSHTHTQTVACTNCQRVSVHIRIQQAPLLTQQFSVGHCWELWSRLPPKLMWRCRCGKLMPQWCKLPRSCRFLGCCLSGGEWIPPLRSEVGQRDEPVQPGWEEPGLCASGSLRVSCSHNVKDIDSHDSLFNRPHSNQMCACSSPRNC